jgi:uncharacterized protein YlxW (UPF0749 family)
VNGEHVGGSRPDMSVWQRVGKSISSRRAKHRPRLGAMSTSLLNDLLSDHLDKGYAEAAARRAGRTASGEGPQAPRSGRLWLALGLLLAAFLFAAAFRATTTQAPESERTQQALVHDVQAGSATSDRLKQRAEDLSARLVQERDAVLATSEAGDRVTRLLQQVETAAALVPVRGPGITVELGDAGAGQLDPATGDRIIDSPEDSGRLRDRDLQSVVNALWEAGAEAVSINHERLAPTTAIRAAGEAILVDLFPLTSPYTIEAIGNPDTLLPRFADSSAARRYQSLVGVYGIRFGVQRSLDLQLRAATGTELRYAHPLDEPATGGAPGGRPGSGASPSATGSAGVPPVGGS